MDKTDKDRPRPDDDGTDRHQGSDQFRVEINRTTFTTSAALVIRVYLDGFTRSVE